MVLETFFCFLQPKAAARSAAGVWVVRGSEVASKSRSNLVQILHFDDKILKNVQEFGNYMLKNVSG